jgi:transcriptional regulator with XRE-family HTH domain
MPPTAGRTLVERHEVEQFARRLNQLMLDKGWSQSDLARAAFGETTDKRGYTVARNRDRISTYLRGAGFPDPVNLQKLAEALGTTKEELAPDITGSAIERENPEIALTAIAGHADRVLLKVNKLLPMWLAAEIVTLISKHDREK